MTRSCSLSMLLGLVAGLTTGCPGDDSSSEDGATGSAGSTTDPTGATSSGSTGATSSGSTTAMATSTTEGPADSGTTGEPGGPPCRDVTCNASEYCDWGVNSCGNAEFDEGTCTARPKGCGAVYEPVCGCDGQVHGNECDANVAGIDVDSEGACTPPDGYFACGFRFCNLDISYCQVSVSDIGGFPDGYSCIQPAEPCDPLSCDCLMNEPCFEFSCEQTPDGGIEIVCPGG